MPQPKDDLSRSLVALDQHKTLIAVVELSSSTWLVGGMVPGIEREPLKKLVPDEEALLKLLHCWRDELAEDSVLGIQGLGRAMKETEFFSRSVRRMAQRVDAELSQHRDTRQDITRITDPIGRNLPTPPECD